jgi:proline iminopeptidase
MDKKILYIVPWIFLFIGVIACTRDDDFLFLRNKGADMPISIKGNKASGIFIVYLHGGPGNGTYVWEDFFKEIEKNYAIVYWNQRAAGESQGNAKPATMTINQFVEDTHQVITLINQLYDHPRVFLMGHSWGGLLGIAYLVQHTSGISGWIEVDGAHNKILGAKLSKEWVMDFAERQIDAGKDVDYWQDALNWYNTYTGPLTYTTRHYTEYLDRAHAYYYKTTHRFYTINDFLFGRPNGFDLLLNGSYSDRTLQDEIVAVDLTPMMHTITIPALICWGRHDGALPAQLAKDAYNALGTDSLQKSIVYFEESAHSPMLEETDAFNRVVINFIDKCTP